MSVFKRAPLWLSLLVFTPAYATTTTINFDAAVADVPLDEYPNSGAPVFAYLTEGGGATVDDANARVQANGFGVGTTRARYTGVGTTTGDQDVTATVLVKSYNNGGVLMRCSAVADTCYAAIIEINETNEVRLYRIVAGTPTLISSWDDSLAAGTHTIRGRATGSGASVELSVQVGAGSIHTFSDTDAARLTSGYPGLMVDTDENYTQLDTWIVDDLASSGTTLLMKRRRH